jgi:hypothetical protein
LVPGGSRHRLRIRNPPIALIDPAQTVFGELSSFIDTQRDQVKAIDYGIYALAAA